MNYRLDKRNKERKSIIIGVSIGIVFLIIVATTSLSHAFGGIFTAIARPLWKAQAGIENRLSIIASGFVSKASLGEENNTLRQNLDQANAKLFDMQALVAQNESFKELLGRKSADKNLVAAGILAKPDRTPYDTLIIDAGSRDGIVKDALVLAFGNIPIGRISDVYTTTSKAVLFSTPGQSTGVVLADGSVAETMIGRGGGNFEMTLERDILIKDGDVVYMPGLAIEPVAVVGDVVSDVRDPFQKILLTSPVNIQHLNLVEIER